MQLNKNIIYIALLLSVIPNLILAQKKDSSLDPAGYVLKYDPNFKGVGPEVYVLPAPRTKEEHIRDSYVKILPFQDSIYQALQFQRLLTAFQSTSNEGLVLQTLQPIPSTTQQWNQVIDSNIKADNHALAYGILNEYAKIRLQKKETSAANSILESALKEAQSTIYTQDIGVIQSNLSQLFFYNKEYVKAGLYEEAYYNQAVKDKNIVDQAHSLVQIARIQAYDKDYKSAENTIIRKAIPLMNKAKDYEGKIKGWVTLAEIYQIQNKHTQAQWFLIQAQTLATTKNLSNELAEIEYMLAYSKFIEKNYRISKNELITALELAKKENNKVLQLTIIEHLGRIYLQENKIDDAEDQLTEYWIIRKDLFNKV